MALRIQHYKQKITTVRVPSVEEIKVFHIKTFIKTFILSLILIPYVAFPHEIKNSHFDSQTYYENSQLQNKWAVETIQTLPIAKNETILDIGSGDGRVTAYLSKLVPQGHVTGIDVSENMVAFASKNFPKSSFPNLDFRHQSAESFELNQQFDYVLSFSTLHWVPDLNKVFNKIHNHLKLQGKFVLYFGPDFGENRIDNIIERVALSKKWEKQLSQVRSGLSLATPQAINEMLIQAKLRPESLTIIRTHESFENAKAFKEWLQAALPHLKMLSQNQQDDFMQDIVEQYVKFYPSDKDGTFHYYDYMIKVIGSNG